MTVRYVGSGGSDSNDGLSWANRKLTLNGAEDTPVVAGDIVYVAPGVYRELLTADVAGSDGSPITYIGDVTGEHTDGVGGLVRITGSDDDQTVTRTNCISLPNARSYRTFRGFLLDSTNNAQILLNASSSNMIVEDCVFLQGSSTGTACVTVNGTGTGCIVRRCIFISCQYACLFSHIVAVDDANHLVENCLSINSTGWGVRVDRVGGIAIKNCTISHANSAVRVSAALSVGQTITVNNCILTGCSTALVATTTGEIVEDYNCLFGNGSNYSNVTAGSNTLTYPPLFNMPMLLDGFRYPWQLFELSKWSKIARQAGTSEATDDLFGVTRPTTSSKKSWGGVQATGAIRETTTVQGGSVASVKLPDAGEQFLVRIPVANESTTVSIYCYREADYAGTNPQMIIRQPGQSDRTTTDAGSASTWNQLTDTFTPAALPPYVDVFIKSSNTATSGNYDTFFDTLEVS